jgi:hypothetical protein
MGETLIPETNANVPTADATGSDTSAPTGDQHHAKASDANKGTAQAADESLDLGSETATNSGTSRLREWGARLQQILRRMWPLRVRDSEATDDGKSVLVPRIIGGETREVMKQPDFWGHASVILVVATLLTVSALAVIGARTRFRNPQHYVSDLYHFEIADTTSFEIEDTTAPKTDSADFDIECRGVTLIAADCLATPPTRCAHVKVCYVGNTTKKTLAGYWNDRQEKITRKLSFNPEVGLPKSCNVGQQMLPGRAIVIKGKQDEKAMLLAWHMLMTEYENQVYVIEILCSADECATAEQQIKRLINGVKFQPGVISTDTGSAR